MEQLTLEITGMSCGHCVGSVRNALASVKGVEVQDVIIGKATVRIDPAQVTKEQLVDAVEDQGYDVVSAA
jgi:copper chaperone